MLFINLTFFTFFICGNKQFSISSNPCKGVECFLITCFLIWSKFGLLESFVKTLDKQAFIYAAYFFLIVSKNSEISPLGLSSSLSIDATVSNIFFFFIMFYLNCFPIFFCSFGIEGSFIGYFLSGDGDLKLE